jgi:hypothetical protein
LPPEIGYRFGEIISTRMSDLITVCNPEIEKHYRGIKIFYPVMDMCEIVYSWGTLAFSHSSSLGSTEVGLVVSFPVL